MIEEGVKTIIEVGPGKVLTGLIKRINKKVNVYNIDGIDSLKYIENKWN
jgi:[acyl-carrier-protein] S-malonyltransferase